MKFELRWAEIPLIDPEDGFERVYLDSWVSEPPDADDIAYWIHANPTALRPSETTSDPDGTVVHVITTL